MKYRNCSTSDNSQMMCAAKAGVLQEVLANQFKKTKQGEALKVAEKLLHLQVRFWLEERGYRLFLSFRR